MERIYSALCALSLLATSACVDTTDAPVDQRPPTTHGAVCLADGSCGGLVGILQGNGVQPSPGDGRAPRRSYGLSGGFQPDAYGPGVGMDQYGRAVHTAPGVRLQPNAYGPGVHMDQYGRAVRCYDYGGRVVCE